MTLNEARIYLSLSEQRFNQLVRPHLREVPVGKRGLRVLRVEIDAWADQYERGCGRPAPSVIKKEVVWAPQNRQGSFFGTKSGTSTSMSAGSDDFASLRARIRELKRK